MIAGGGTPSPSFAYAAKPPRLRNPLPKGRGAGDQPNFSITASDTS